MKKYLIILLGLVLIAAMSGTDIEKRIQRLEDNIEVMKQHLKTKKITCDNFTTDTVTVSTLTVTYSMGSYEDRGNLTKDDFHEAYTFDGTWYDLDLSTIVPTYTSAILIEVSIQDGTAEKQAGFRENGDVNAYNAAYIYTQVADIHTTREIIVQCDSDRKIEYMGDAGIDELNITIRGWWK
jgi:uncharacterized protein YxeA